MLSVVALQTEQVTLRQFSSVNRPGLLADKKMEGRYSGDYFGNACFLLIDAFRMLFAVNIRSKDIITIQENLKCWTRGKSVCPQRQILARRKVLIVK